MVSVLTPSGGVVFIINPQQENIKQGHSCVLSRSSRMVKLSILHAEVLLTQTHGKMILQVSIFRSVFLIFKGIEEPGISSKNSEKAPNERETNRSFEKSRSRILAISPPKEAVEY